MNQINLMGTYQRLPVSFVRGSGNTLWDSNGVEYLDAISGVAVNNLGHAHPEVTKEICDQAATLVHTSNLFGIDWQSRLGTMLCDISGLDKVFFCNSGCEANEAALKLARIYGRELGISSPRVVVMDMSFHGRTLATNAASSNEKLKVGFEYEPLVGGFLRAPFDKIESLEELARIHNDIAAVFVEPIQGEGGVRLPSRTYLSELRKICDKQGWLLMLDEVQTGIGRTGSWFAFQQTEIFPDILTLAKALGNGIPIGACLARGKAAKLFGLGSHGSTFGGNPLACRAACTVLNIIDRERLLVRAKKLGYLMLGLLRKRLGNIKGVIAIKGQGLMIGIELCSPCTEIMEQALLNERILISITRGSTLRLLPSLITTDEEAIDIVERVSRLVTKWLLNHDNSSASHYGNVNVGIK